MSEDFFSRWSRRKREVAKAEPDAAKPPPSDAPAEEAPPQAAAASGEPPSPAGEPDLSNLPPLETITGTTDITGFLRRGVPEELTRTALRKAWSSDPAIRDFIGPSENAWDFNDPTAIPGFGPIDFSSEQVRQMAARLVGDVGEASDAVEQVLDTALQQQPDAPAPAKTESSNITEQVIAPAPIAERAPDVATQDPVSDDTVIPPARRHGGALPQ